MSTLTVTPTKMRNGVWQGIVCQTGTGVPQINVTHLGVAVPDVTLEEGKSENEWQIDVQIPLSAIADGVQVFILTDATDGAQLGQFTLIAGEALGDDIRSEVELLRAELDLLKRAFRRHCVETT